MTAGPGGPGGRGADGRRLPGRTLLIDSDSGPGAESGGESLRS